MIVFEEDGQAPFTPMKAAALAKELSKGYRSAANVRQIEEGEELGALEAARLAAELKGKTRDASTRSNAAPARCPCPACS